MATANAFQSNPFEENAFQVAYQQLGSPPFRPALQSANFGNHGQ
jgi:hypothetical protein